MSFYLKHNDNGLPLHASNSDSTPHLTVGGSFATHHIPYSGQTTLGMYGIGQPGESLQHIKDNNLGTLNYDNSTFSLKH